MSRYKFMNDDVLKFIEIDMPTIEGWVHTVAQFTLPVLAYAQTQIGVSGDIVEIGAWHGKSALLLERLTNEQEAVVAYDVDLKAELFDNIAKFSLGRLTAQPADSMELSSAIILESRENDIRMFHVDGYHSYQHALNDLTLAVESCSHEGVVVLDDFFSSTVPGVSEAFFELLLFRNSRDFFPFAIGGGKVYLSHSSKIDYYRDALFEFMPMPCNNGQDVDKLFGRRVAIYDLW